jgi:hypothetical protein
MEAIVIGAIGAIVLAALIAYKIGYDNGRIDGLKIGKKINDTIKYERKTN